MAADADKVPADELIAAVEDVEYALEEVKAVQEDGANEVLAMVSATP